ncbi:MAG: hypothetical protein AAB739_00240 [Patescibacteria group bacterium]
MSKKLLITIAITILLIVSGIYFVKTNSGAPESKITSTGIIPSGGIEE